jgi:hypothetical protein
MYILYQSCSQFMKEEKSQYGHLMKMLEHAQTGPTSRLEC